MSDDLARRLADLVAKASDGEIAAAEAGTGTGLRALGLSSLGHLRLIQLVENDFGVVLDLDADTSYLDSVASLAGYLRGQGVHS